MAVYLGNNKITFDGISEIYVGSNKVYSAAPPDYSTEYFFVENLTNSTNTLNLKPLDYSTSFNSSPYAPEITVYYSLDKNTWQSGVVGGSGENTITYTIPAKSKVYLKATTTAWGYKANSSAGGSNRIFCSDGNFSVGGNVMSLLYGDNFIGQTTLSTAYSFSDLLRSAYSSSLIDIDRLVLPATTLADYCYYKIFRGCTSLTTIPSNLLPATTLATYCYYEMFYGCTSLTTIPSNLLPATTLAEKCYWEMFLGCTGLTSIPSTLLPATTLAGYCYYRVFYGCTGLTSIPSTLLHSTTTLAEQCYREMFKECTGLTSVPSDLLPATTLAEACYYGMFHGCTSLTTVPSNLLPATTLQSACYGYMFYGCSSLNTSPELPATTLASYCYNDLFYGCSSLNEITCSANDISASNCTASWVYGVAASGTFHQRGNAAWTTGINGIPTGWTVIDERPYDPINDYFWVENTSNASKRVCFNLVEVYKSSSWNSLQERFGSGTLYYSTDKTTWSTISMYNSSFPRIVYLTVPANTKYYLYISWSTGGTTYGSFNYTYGGTADISGWGAYINWGGSDTGRCSTAFRAESSSDKDVFAIGGNIRTITGNGQSGVSSTTQNYYDRSYYNRGSNYTNVRYWTGLGKSTDSVINNQSQSGLYFQYIKDASKLYIGATDVVPSFLNSGPNFVGPIYT